MSSPTRYVKGNWKAVCDSCGFRFDASKLKKRWDGLMVCEMDYETRQPQDFVRAKVDIQAVPWTRPESTQYQFTLTPTANISLLVGSANTYTAINSISVTGSPLTYQWVLSKPIGSLSTLTSTNTVTTSFNPDMDGIYTLSLVVSTLGFDSTPSLYTISFTNTAFTWVSNTFPSNRNWLESAYGNGVFVYTGYNNAYTLTSPDGDTWTEQASLPFTRANGLYFTGTKFICAQDYASSMVAMSTDGVNWNSVSTGTSGYWYDITGDTTGNTLVLVGDSINASYAIKTSLDAGATWSQSNFSVAAHWTGIVYGNGLFVAVGSNGSTEYVSHSIDGVTWSTAATLPNVSTTTLDRILYGNGVFLITGDNTNFVLLSTDGITWTSHPLPVTVSPYGAKFVAGKFVIPPYNNISTTLLESLNGIDWIETTLPNLGNWNSMCSDGISVILNNYTTTQYLKGTL